MSGKRIDLSIKTCSVHDGHWCSFGSHGRRPTKGEFIFIEKVEGEWPDWAKRTAGISHIDVDGNRLVDFSILDALSDHTEGET